MTRLPWLRAAVVAVLVAWAFLPLAEWLPGPVTTPGYSGQLGSWILGLMFPVLCALVILLAGVETWLGDFREPSGSLPSLLARLGLPLLCASALAMYAWSALDVFDGLPLHVDSMTQAAQARIFASGRIWMATPENPEFTSSMLMVDRAGRTYAQFPPGWAALLAVGELLGTPWLMAPTLGALAVGGVYALFRVLGETRTTAFVGSVVFGASPWIVFNAGSQMNHVMALTSTVFASALVIRAHGEGARSWISPAAAGLLLGACAWVRPLEAAAFALPALVWAVTAGDPRQRVARTMAMSGGLLMTGGGLLLYNAWMNGGPLTFGYEVQWGAIHGLGFHEAPFGPPHTPVRGVELVNKYLLQLQTVLFESGAPSLLAALLALASARSVRAGDRYLLASSGLVLLGYFAYWHDGDYLGPRFLLTLAPVAVLWTVRFPGIVADRLGSSGAGWAAAGALAVMLVTGLGFGAPARWAIYETMVPQRRFDAGELRERSELRDAIVLVPTTWGTQVQARMWARGLPRRDAEWIRGRVDLCRLDYEVAQLERQGIVDPLTSARRLIPLTADSARVRPSTLSPDTTQKMLPEARYPPACMMRLQEERGGISILPFLPGFGEGPIVVRDMHERNHALFVERIRPVYRLDLGGDGTLETYPVDLDSARYQWDGWLRAATN